MFDNRLNTLFNNKEIKLIIFDLDGTLVDTFENIKKAINSVFINHGLSQLKDETIRKCIGYGGNNIIIEGLDNNNAQYDAKLVDYLYTSYIDQCLIAPVYGVTVYQGVIELLKKLHDSEIKVAICTNKIGSLANKILVNFGLITYFDCVVAGDSLENKKPSPCQINYILDCLQVEQENTLLVGDSQHDIQASFAAGITPIFAEYGYGQNIVASSGVATVKCIRELSYELEVMCMKYTS